MNIQIKLAELHRIAEQMNALCDGDEQLFADMMEGESDVDRIILRIHEQIARDTEMLVGIKERQSAIAERRARIEHRIDAGKAAIGMTLRAAMLPKIEMPEATYSVRDGKSGIVVVDPDAVPDEYRRIKSEPDKTKINTTFADADSLPNWLVRTDAKDVVSVRTK